MLLHRCLFTTGLPAAQAIAALLLALGLPPEIAKAQPPKVAAASEPDRIACVALYRWVGEKTVDGDEKAAAGRATARAEAIAKSQVPDNEYAARVSAAGQALTDDLEGIRRKQGDKAVDLEVAKRRASCAEVITASEKSDEWGANEDSQKTWDVVMSLESHRFMPEAALKMCETFDPPGQAARKAHLAEWVSANSWKVSIFDGYVNFLGPKLFPNAPIGSVTIVEALHDGAVDTLATGLKALSNDDKSHYCGKFDFLPLFTAALDDPIFRGSLEVLDRWIAAHGFAGAPLLSLGAAAGAYKTEYLKPITEVFLFQEQAKVLSSACDEVDPDGKPQRQAAYDHWTQSSAAALARVDQLARDVTAQAQPRKSGPNVANSYDWLRRKAVDRAAALPKSSSAEEKKSLCADFASSLSGQAPMAKVVRDAALYLEKWKLENPVPH